VQAAQGHFLGQVGHREVWGGEMGPDGTTDSVLE
jgi:hypothetical protein